MLVSPVVPCQHDRSPFNQDTFLSEQRPQTLELGIDQMNVKDAFWLGALVLVEFVLSLKIVLSYYHH